MNQPPTVAVVKHWGLRESGDVEMPELVSNILNNALYLSILVILLSSVIGFYVKMHLHDRCLRDFDGFEVVVEDKGGKVVWGTLKVYSSGLELIYTGEHWDREGHVETSYILYDKDLVNLQAIYRFHDDQSPANRRKRTRDIKHTYRPNLFRRARRAVRNVLSTFKDAIVQSLNTILGYRAAQSPQAAVLSKHKELTTTGAQLLSGAAGNAYEPILERHIGHYVVVEIVRGARVEEEYGILKEYSAKYLEILNARLEVPMAVYLKDRKPPHDPPVEVKVGAGSVHVKNYLDRPLLVDTIRCEKKLRKVELCVERRAEVEVPLTKDEMGKQVQVDVAVRCLADLIVPRSLAVVRHAGEREKPSLEVLLGLDELYSLPWVRRLTKAIAD